MNIEDLLSDNIADYSLFDKPDNDISNDMIKKYPEFYEKDQKFIEIDFEKLKTVLSKLPNKEMSESELKELNL